MMIYDISMTIHKNMQVYKNKTEKIPVFTQTASFTENGVYETDISLNMHTGTHIDFPLHTIIDGNTSNIDYLDKLVGKAKVFNLDHVNFSIDKSDLIALDIKENDFILLRTKNSFDETFNPDFVFLNKSAARYLVNKKIRGVGIDSLGIERAQPNHPTHDLLLGNGIIILEGLRLKAIKEDEYDFYCLPLKIENVEALLARAILIK
ncbi:cyclase family protein [Mycoplasmatota bacterium WC30]